MSQRHASIGATPPPRLARRRSRPYVALTGSCLLSICLGCKPSVEAPKRILFVTIDTLRWDKLGYAGADIETPTLNRLAEQGTTFTQAVTVAPMTLPSHASMFSALYPPHHGTRHNGSFSLASETETLAEILKAQGFHTGAFVGAFVLDSRYGLDQGFDIYDDELPDDDTASLVYYPERRAEVVVERAIEWMRARGEDPYFAWVHVFDVHAPYDPPSPFRERYGERAYDGEVAYTDSALAPLIAEVNRLDGGDESLVVVTSDHGESLGEHGESTHTYFIYDSTMRVPLIMSGAGFDAGSRVDAQVRTVDIAPTILDLLEIDYASPVDGASLLPLIAGADEPPRAAYGETFGPRFNLGWSELRFLRKDGYKLIEAPRRELYDLRDDPTESHNLWVDGSVPSVGRSLLRELAPIRDADRVDLTPSVPLDEDTVSRLESLGYMTGGEGAAGREVERERSDPKDRVELYERLQKLLSPELSPDEVIREYRAVLIEDPDNLLVRNRLANLLSDEGRLEESVAEYRALMQTSELEMKGLENLAAVLLLLDEPEQALAVADKAVASASWNPDFFSMRGESLERLGRLAEAEEAYRHAIELDPQGPEHHWRLAEVLNKRGERDQAMQILRRTVDEAPDFIEARLALGRLLSDVGQPEEALRILSLGGGDETSADFLATRGQALLGQGELDEAEEVLLRAEKKAPDNTRVLALLGPMYGRLGQMERARSYLERAVELGETSPDVRRNLALVYAQQGRFAAAVEQLEIACDTAPEDEGLWFTLGNVRLQARRHGAAADAFNQALRRRPDWPEALFSLALSSEQAGRGEQAAEAYRRFLASEPRDARRRDQAEKRLRALGGR